MKLLAMMMTCVLAAACGGKKTAQSTTGPTTEEPGQSCAQEVALVCPEGQIDACLKDPDEGNFHKCVPRD